ncbi:MAG TPA: glycoside hydrolase family 15 protein [Kofleriaceae bacterium]|nr:glycoside hydrolase family 15 protein [Kofleriaceae bacterium]
MRIEDYAIVGDTQTLALVGRDGSIDWLCFPRFDSDACFAALLGSPDQGRWRVAPASNVTRVRRRYIEDTLVLETEFTTDEGTVRLIDYMPIRGRAPDIVRIVEGVEGRVRIESELTIRFVYGSVVPWVRKLDGRLHAVAGPDALVLATPAPREGRGLSTVSSFVVTAGERVPFVLTWYPSNEEPPPTPDPFTSLTDTIAWWREWAAQCKAEGPYRHAVVRSLITLKALTYQPSGGIVAAGTTSLPEDIGGERNWDYRYCWIRDATFTLQAMLHAGYLSEAKAWRDWLLRAVGGDPDKLQIMYGVLGERRLEEHTLPWLSGYECSQPVRVGNDAAKQLQLDVYGEVIDMLYEARMSGLGPEEATWALERTLLDWLEQHWPEADEGIWEPRGGRRHFTFSKVMVWAAFDRAVKSVERCRVEGPVDRWRAIRDRIHADVCKHGYDASRNTFVQAYDSKELDASLLLIPHVGFLPARDPRFLGTIQAIEEDLLEGGFVMRYRTSQSKADNIDGLSGFDSPFIACSFWLVDAYALVGRRDDAVALFERTLALRNDLGLLSEEYDTRRMRLCGNFPQAFSHVALVNSARNLHECETGPAALRGR